MDLPVPSRRDFLKASAAALPVAASAHAAASDILRVGVIGCGARGPDAAKNAITADKGVRIAAMGDLLRDRAQEKRTALKVKFPGQVTADDDHCFGGLDAYQRVIENSDVVIIANAAKFHPMHMMAAIDAGKHVFVEKPHAIDPGGIQVVRAACEKARRKNLCVVSGLHSRYQPGYIETVRRIRDGAAGKIISIEENFLRAPYQVYSRRPGLNELEWQGSNQYHFHWLSGDDVIQSLVHNLDRASWVLGDAAPLKCHGMGGRSTLRGEKFGSVFDHHAVVYEFPGGVRVYALCRTIPGCYNEYSSILAGSRGTCSLMDKRISGDNPWVYDGHDIDGHEAEHLELFKALRAGRTINNGDYMIRSTLIAIMGQISCYTGQEITWNQIANSDFYFPPRPEDVRAGMEAPVLPGPDGIYPVFMPGVTKLL